MSLRIRFLNRAATVLVVFIAACSAPNKQDSAKSGFREALAYENFKLHQILTTQANQKFEMLDLSQYYSLLERQNPQIVAEIKAFEKVEFGHTYQVFVVCVQSAKPTLTICDNSSTPFIDRVKVTPILKLNALMDEIRGP